MKRKTILVSSIVDKANKYLALETIPQAEKKAIAEFTANILHETGNYRGFNYNFQWENTDECRAKEYDRYYFYRA